jgi:hypothetical protein
MRSVLHIFTREDELGRSIAEAQSTLPETKVEAVTLSESADYDALLDQIFAADSIEVW